MQKIRHTTPSFGHPSAGGELTTNCNLVAKRLLCERQERWIATLEYKLAMTEGILICNAQLVNIKFTLIARLDFLLRQGNRVE
jgi:hypothetical protein